ncbi:unnamed protein product [Paramecium primaurelia]|uniref:Uncharacterized protein n=1 Tax=Paramecium primaurelia TaxID=5886 RepID=A0A8S1Q909_PARPR|nr:unnamed protein product [Paramecium primaurelia]
MSQKFKFVEQSKTLPLIVRQPIAVMNLNLYKKYQHSQNYYYIREINEILSDASTKHVIHFKDWLTMDEEDEYFKRFYKIEEYPQKIALLTEYYKFHADIARIFQEPVCTVLNKYYDKKRKYDYFRIAKIIEEENKLNPQKPPKGIVGDRPSPANSQESLPQEQEEGENEVVHTQVLKEISWLKNQKTLNKDASHTLNQILKHLEYSANLSSFSIAPIPKKDKISLDNFLLYIGTKFNKKQKTSPNPNKQSQEQRIQDLILKQKAKMQQKGQPSYSLHKKSDTKYSIGSTEKKITFVKDQCNNLSKKSNRQASTDIIESLTKLDTKPQEQIKNKSKITVAKNQLKINKIIRDVNQNNTPTPSLHKVSISSTHLKTQQPQIIQQNNNLKLNSLAKLLIEDTYNDHQHNKLKQGAITHRPLSGTNTLFTSYSNRNSPSINYKKSNLQNSKPEQKKGKSINSTQQSQQFGQLAKTLFKKVLNSKKSKPINHIKQSSNHILNQFDKLKINCNSQQQYNDFSEKKQHKKNKSDGKALYNKLSIPDIGCLTERHDKESPLLNFHSNNSHSSPQTQHFRRLHSEKQESISKNIKGLMIQQMLKQLAKQNQQNQQKQELRSIIKTSQKKF